MRMCGAIASQQRELHIINLSGSPGSNSVCGRLQCLGAPEAPKLVASNLDF